jgi:hypothetical protein
MLEVICTLLALGPASPPAAATPAGRLHTEAAPRMDPVFDDVGALRRAIDQFFVLQADMEKVRDEFSGAVHDTLASLGPIGAHPTQTCPAELAPLYDRASVQGRRFLGLGRRLAVRSREIRRADELGDTVGLTPDYRIKARKVRELYLALLRDYREMRAAFYDQLGAEMRHAGCRDPASATGAPPATRDAGGPMEPTGPNPANASDWVLDPAEDDAPAAAGGKARRARGGAATEAVSAGTGPAIWIEIDNTRCPQAAALTIDGQEVGEIAGQKKNAVRTRSGPHELCVLPAGAGRTCGAPGTIRRAYLYEGWTLAVRCEK